jgi:hypothetical protein
MMEIPARRKLILLDVHVAIGPVFDAPGRGAVRGGPAQDPPRPRGGGDRTVALVRGDSSPEIGQLLQQRGAQAVIIASSSGGQALESAGLRHGLFTFALLEAFSSAKADVNRDQQLAVMELAEFLAVRVRELAAEAGGSQEVTTVATGAAGLDWTLAELRDESRQVVVRRYQERLSTWEMGGWISFETKIEALRVLKLWEKEPAGGGLTRDDTRILEEVQKHLDRASAAQEEEAVAGSLDITLRMLVKKP